ncbi:MAG: ABC transporter permease [Azospirillaceae bacterium]|nr:ABC transporter permease [Azospirillaceae bacterium]
MGFYVAQFLGGLAQASSLFIVASGLSIIFGVTRIVNFAHGTFYMVGAFVAYSIADRVAGAWGFWGGIATAALVAGGIGVALERLLLRRLYQSPALFQLLATFGVVLVGQDAVLAIWGPEDRLGPRAPGLAGRVHLLGQAIPHYDLFLIVLGPVVLGLLWLLFHRTRWGVLVRAATEDREMTAALGVDESRLFTTVLFLGALLAGLAGAIQLPREAVTLHMDVAVVVEAFVVVVVGGMGSVTGAFLAALLIGQLQAFGILLVPRITVVLAFLVMAIVLAIRPYGLLGRVPALPRGTADAVEPPLRPASPGLIAVALALTLVLAALPVFAGDYVLALASETLIMVLFAASLQFIMGPGGMMSFGHAAYFGLGAYGAGLVVKHFGATMVTGLVAAPLLAGLAALVFGWFCVRLSGVYLAMLTLAFAQIAWSVMFEWTAVTGGDNGILGVWPASWAATAAPFYELCLGLSIAALLLLRRIVFAPFGYAVRAGRDSPLRCEAIGIDVQRFQWLAFVIAGVLAGLAGGLFAYAKGSVFPTYLDVPVSVDGLVMVLLGGVQSLVGPIVGAVVFHGLETQLVRLTDYWRLVVGVIIILLVLAFPQGIAGALGGRLRSGRSGTGEAGR